MSERDQRALKLLGGAVIVFLLLQFGLPAPSGGDSASASSGSIVALEERLKTMQTQVRQKPVDDAHLAAAERELAGLESRLLTAANPSLAQAEMRSLAGELLSSEGIVMGSSRFGTVDLEGLDYVRMPIDITFNRDVDFETVSLNTIRIADTTGSTAIGTFTQPVQASGAADRRTGGRQRTTANPQEGIAAHLAGGLTRIVAFASQTRYVVPPIAR